MQLFAKPFVCALEGHADGVYALARAHDELGVLVYLDMQFTWGSC